MKFHVSLRVKEKHQWHIAWFHKQNRTEICLDPTRNALQYGYFPRKYHKVGVVFSPRWANGLPGVGLLPLKFLA